MLEPEQGSTAYQLIQRHIQSCSHRDALEGFAVPLSVKLA
jgi:hypothetical protein